jgi:hypothetical protein
VQTRDDAHKNQVSKLEEDKQRDLDGALEEAKVINPGYITKS